ncbi:hypothetical protein TYRP_009480 [Tyrophagus putrescentiae]|nr:hypothetical protein TYRP_009480 [Tyrophagus putrescentiae]
MSQQQQPVNSRVVNGNTKVVTAVLVFVLVLVESQDFRLQSLRPRFYFPLFPLLCYAGDLLPVQEVVVVH